ncbi:MAG TPA: hypothetical protein VMP01_01190 [Pirellulaceae bacterium]|nr:hypothetical protein [Pirellulaceae bacterium]
MLLSPADAELFFKLLRGLMWYVNQQLQVVETTASGPDEFSNGPVEDRVKVREAFLENPQLLEKFVDENTLEFNDEELEIVAAWRDYQFGRFIVFRQLQKHAVFMTTQEPAAAYGVVALTDPIELLTGRRLPIFTECLLLPFRGRIVYDGLMNSFNISFGPGIRRSLNESYQRTKRESGIVTRLDSAAEARPIAAVNQKSAGERKVKQPANRFRGRWVIQSVENWELDGDEDATLAIRSHQAGRFQFAGICGIIDYRVVQRDGGEVLEFSWEGNDGGFPVSGRGRGVIVKGQLHGELYVHHGDESAFVASRAKPRPRLSRS